MFLHLLQEWGRGTLEMASLCKLSGKEYGKQAKHLIVQQAVGQSTSQSLVVQQ